MKRLATVGEVREVEYGRGVGHAVEEKSVQLAEVAVRGLATKMGRNPHYVAYILLDVLKNLLGPSWR